jgi:cellulose synthase/poly-beta-1,6-N-acetylglucosamine synthase-like glycosyltransferase
LIGLTLLIAMILALPVAITAYFAVEVLAGLRPLRPTPKAQDGHGSVVVVIPAHDEEAVIGATVRETLGSSRGEFKVLVVADNCVDATSEEARAAGATVVLRDDPDLRGKGYALAAARDWLRGSPPDVVIVLDADCRSDGASLRALAGTASESGRPCQAVNLLAPDLSAAPLVQLSTFAFMIKNLIRQRGLQRLSERAHLTGTGMAFPWAIFADADLGGSNIVEDLALGLELAERTAPPMLVPDATVWSPAAPGAGTLVQRRRWEGGYLATALKTAPVALLQSLRRADWPGAVAALNLCVPPLALLVLINIAVLVIALLGVLAGAAVWPLIVQVTVGIFAAIAITLAWLREGKRFASARTLLRLPFYVLWKLPMYVGLARRGAPKDWLRTGR